MIYGLLGKPTCCVASTLTCFNEFRIFIFLSVKTIETNLLRKYYLQVTTNDEKTFLFPLFSTDIKSTGYQNQNSQIVSYKFVYIFLHYCT